MFTIYIQAYTRSNPISKLFQAYIKQSKHTNKTVISKTQNISLVDSENANLEREQSLQKSEPKSQTSASQDANPKHQTMPPTTPT